ncbi:MAG: glycerol-3-phosphate acyltransferase, partial [Candidatus Aminicenantes bacterium]
MKIVVALASYLLGSVPTGYLLVRLSGKRDVRKFGSGSTGATNVLRVKGWKAALPVAVFDFLKGFLPVFLANRWFA